MPSTELVQNLTNSGIILPDQYINLAVKVNQPIGASLEDATSTHQLFYEEDSNLVIGGVHWRDFVQELPEWEKQTLTRSLGAAYRGYFRYHQLRSDTLGEIRELSIKELLGIEGFGPLYTGFIKLAFERYSPQNLIWV